MSDLAYLAGIIDGEGSVGNHSAGVGKRRFVIEVKMTDEPLIDWLVATFGGFKQFRPKQNIKWKDQWRWRVQGKSAESLYAQVLPHLRIKII